MGIYSADEHFLNIFFKETTIVRRLNVHGIQLRMMIVVSIYNNNNKNHTHRHILSVSHIRVHGTHLHWSIHGNEHTQNGKK